MHPVPSPFASVRPRRPRPDASHRLGRPYRRPLETLESRLLFAAGDFDLTFSGDGAALVDFGSANETGSSVLTLPGGKVIVGGSVGTTGTNTDDVFALARLNADGTLDTTFGGGDGIVTADFGPDADLESLALAPDGRIVAVGRVDNAAAGTDFDWAVTRFTADGVVDTTFGGDGTVTTDFSFFRDSAYGVDVQPDGKIVVTGVVTRVDTDIAVARYNVDGSLDSGFNDDGRTFVDFSRTDFASAIKVQPDNKLVVVGSLVQPGSYRRFALVRLNADGSLDNTFDGDGQATADYGAAAFAKDVEIQSDGKYVVGGWFDSNPDPFGDEFHDFIIARFNANGSVDSGFGTGGRTVFAGTGGDALRSYGLEIQQNGRILLGGTTKDDTGRTFGGVARVTTTGLPDTTFGPGGLREFTIPGTTAGTSVIHDLELDPDGRIVLGGYPMTTAGGGTDFAVVRLLNDDGPPPVPGSISGVVFNDLDQDGVRDVGEAGLSGWTVFQDTNNNGTLDSGPVTAVSTDVPKVISIEGTPTVTSTIAVSGAGSSISDINVQLNISHTWDDDLIVTLISPSGQEVELFNTVGGSGENFQDTILDDEAPPNRRIQDGTPPFAGSYRPQTPLSTLDGLNPNGTWTLRVFDQVAGDGGSLNSWSLTIQSNPEPSVVTGADGSYTFANVQPGTHTVREIVQNGWFPTVPSNGAHVVEVASGQNVTGRNFGNSNQVPNSAVVGRSIFYNNSSFDGNNPAANAQDDGAIATDKAALRPVHTSTLSNLTSYEKGINGVMIDMTRPGTLAADDFEFRVGNSNSPSLWSLGPSPISITQRPSGLPDGSMRVTITWADGAIRNQWLEVTVKANTDTRLGNPDVFYFGNLVGETVATGGSGPFVVNSNDVMATRAARRAGTVPITEPADHNRDGRVNVMDEILVRNAYGRSLAELIRPRAVEPPFSDTGIVAASGARRTRTAPITRSVLE